MSCWFLEVTGRSRGAALQVGRFRVRFPILSLEFLIGKPSGHAMALGSTQLLKETRIRNIFW